MFVACSESVPVLGGSLDGCMTGSHQRDAFANASQVFQLLAVPVAGAFYVSVSAVLQVGRPIPSHHAT